MNLMRVAPYGSWKSPITSELIAVESINLSEVRIDGGEVYWLESRPQDGGRNVVVRDGRDLTRAPFNVRNRLHEYGGGAWTMHRGVLFFSNDKDGRLYRLDRDAAAPVAITPTGAWRYGDGVVDTGGRWIGVREDHNGSGEAINEIVAIDARGVNALASGHDFFSSPKVSPAGHLAWLAWDHPNMPWDGTMLYLDGTPIAGGSAESIFQPEWSPDGSSLIFASDRSGWWNLYRFDLTTGVTTALAPRAAEFGAAQWKFGLSLYTFAGPSRIVCSFFKDGLGQLAVIDLRSGDFTPVETPYTDFSSVQAEGNRVVFRAAASDSAAAIVELHLATGRIEVLKCVSDAVKDSEVARCFTRVEQIDYPSGDRTAHGLYYPAFHPDFVAPEGERPPLVVKCHGGPTSAASSALDLGIQFWTSRGISVLDVNYGGSTGYGRAYRQLLKGNWGVVDVDDCVNGSRHLADHGLVDPARCVITGRSAGGYTTLAVLAFRDWFRGGASYYGISDLVALARDTHKFESRSMDSLIPEHLREKRSPIRHVEQFTAPVIFLQGDEDVVVPPNQTEMIVNALRTKGVPTAYLLFSGEQHGFRQAPHIMRALDAELLFYAVNVFRCDLSF